MYPIGSQNVQATISDLSSTGDKVTLTPVIAVEIVSFGFIVTTASVDAAGGLVMKCDKRVTAGSDTGRGDGDLGTLTLTSAQANLAAGGVARSRLSGSNTSTPNNAIVGPAPTDSAYTVLPGQQAILELTTAVDSGAAIGFIEYKPMARKDRASSIEVIVST